MIDRRSSALVRAMTSLLIVVFAGAARAEDLRREVDALRQNDRHRPGSGDARQPRAPGPRGPGRDPPVPHGPRCRPHARAAAAGAGTVARRRTAALASHPAAACRRHPSARRDTGSRRSIYESLPGSPVPAHLYVPEGLDRPAPAVLFYPGHWWPDSKARPDFQAFCINMARLGFVVLSFDPFGQGERGVSSRDHRRTEALLVGVAQQGFAEYETRCALEYLLSRPEVDPEAGRDDRGLGRRLQHLDHRGARRPDRGGRAGGGHQRVRRADPRLPAARLVPRGRALPLRPRPDPLRQQSRAAGDGGPEAGPDHRGLSGPELPGRRGAGGRRVTAESSTRPTVPGRSSGWWWTRRRGTATSGPSARRRTGGSSAG